MKKFRIIEYRQLAYIVEVPDSITSEDLEDCDLQSEYFGTNMYAYPDIYDHSDYWDHGVEALTEDEEADLESDVVLDENLYEVLEYSTASHLKRLHPYRLEDDSCKTIATGSEATMWTYLQDRAPDGFYRVIEPDGETVHWVRQGGIVKLDTSERTAIEKAKAE